MSASVHAGMPDPPGTRQTPSGPGRHQPPGPGRLPPGPGKHPPRPGRHLPQTRQTPPRTRQTPPHQADTPLGPYRHPAGPGRHPLGPGRHPHQRDTPPGTRQTPPPPDQADTPLGPGRQPPGKQTPAYSLRAASTHPTGMHSCYRCVSMGGLYDVTSCLAVWSRFFQRVSVQSDFCLEGSLSRVGGLYPGGSLSGRLPCTVKRGYPTGMLSCFIGLFSKCKKYVDLGFALL